MPVRNPNAGAATDVGGAAVEAGSTEGPRDENLPAEVSSAEALPAALEAPRTFAEDLAELKRGHFADTQIGNHTEIWNALQAFEAEVVKLHERHLHGDD